MSDSTWLDNQLDNLQKEHLTRSTRLFPTIKNQKLQLNFSSNDYLNLSNDAVVQKAAKEAIDEWGCGTGGSRLMTGNLPLHMELEEKIAQFCSCQSSLVFGSGFLANYGLISSFCMPGDMIFADKLNHASLIDGMRASGSGWTRYRHKDTEQLEELLCKTKITGKTIIITDTLFSMDGDISPLEKINELAIKYKAWLILDEAHAIGVYGPQGRGLFAELGLKPNEKTIIVGTLSKSFASYGGFVSSSSKVRTYLINKARSFIYSTGLPASSLASSLACLNRCINKSDLGKELLNNAIYFTQLLQEYGFSLGKCESQIVPIHIGDNHLALQLAEKAKEMGLIITAIRPPTVPVGTSRIRISITLAHRLKDLKEGAAMLSKCAKALGIIK